MDNLLNPSLLKDLAPIVAISFIWALVITVNFITETRAHKEKSLAFLKEVREKDVLFIEAMKNKDATYERLFTNHISHASQVLDEVKESNNKLANAIERLIERGR